MNGAPVLERRWWQSAVFYQIYPRSFADGNGDGIGDIPGITSKLDYLRELGVGAVWLSPHYPSPFVDCGYDITDFRGVATEYGTLDDFHHLLHEAHARGIKVVLDLVLNHSSDQHPWFTESRASRANAKRDWYIWRDGREGGPPNNWVSVFGGPAWTLDPATGQHYYHAFLKQQPDLNWRNPALKHAMLQMVRFWLDLGVDGFRLDAVGTVFENPEWPDHRAALTSEQQLNPLLLPQPQWLELMQHQLRQPEVHALMQELRELIEGYPGERVLLGEDDDVSFHGDGGDELHLVFNFPLVRTERLTPAHIRANQAERLAALGSNWPCNTLGSHDSRRLWSCYGDGLHDAALARLHLALLATLRGTPVLYNGEEIGMTDLVLEDLAQVRDTAAIARYGLLRAHRRLSHGEALASVIATTRDRSRNPVQWKNAPHGGFCPPDVAPWLPVNADHARGVNVEDQDRDPGSLLNFYRRVLALRRSTPALLAGDYRALDEANDDVLSFLRLDVASGQTCLVALNFSASARSFDASVYGCVGRVLLSTGSGRATNLSSGSIALEAHEVLIAEFS